MTGVPVLSCPVLSSCCLVGQARQTKARQTLRSTFSSVSCTISSLNEKHSAASGANEHSGKVAAPGPPIWEPYDAALPPLPLYRAFRKRLKQHLIKSKLSLGLCRDATRAGRANRLAYCNWKASRQDEAETGGERGHKPKALGMPTRRSLLAGCWACSDGRVFGRPPNRWLKHTLT